MKRFEFSLARVRDFRKQQLDVEESKLQALLAERRTIELESSRIAGEASETRRGLMVTGAAESQELVARDVYLRHLANVTKRQIAKLAEWKIRAGKQQQAIVEARRRLRLVEKLEERQFADWEHALDREQENLASELYLARWKRN